MKNRYQLIILLAVLIYGCGDSRVSKEIEALKSKSAEERASAALHLAEIAERSQSAVPTLISLLDDPDATVRDATVKALGTIKAEGKVRDKVVNALDNIVEDTEPDVQISVLLALHSLGAKKEHLAASVKLLESKDRKIRFAAIMQIIELSPSAESAIPALIRALNDDDEGVRLHAVYALGSYKEKAAAALPALEQIAEQEEESPSGGGTGREVSLRQQVQSALKKIRGATHDH